MGCIASHLAQENFATNLEKEQKSGMFVLVCTRGNERCNIALFGNKLEGLPQEYAGAVSPQTRMRNGVGICIWQSVVYGSCWCASPRLRLSASISPSHRYGGKWVDGALSPECKGSSVFTFLFTNFSDHPCGWGRAGFGVGNVNGSVLVPDSAMNVCGWFGQDADQSSQKCKLLLAMFVAISVHFGGQGL